MKLIIVESPTKTKTLKKFLGKDYKIVATVGHIRDLPKKKFGVDIPEDYFYNERELTNFLITYNLQSFSEELFLEEWLLEEIISPLNNFLYKIRDSVKKVEEKAIEKALTQYFGENISDKQKREDIEFVSQQISLFWNIIK